jgi:uncharacterized protein
MRVNIDEIKDAGLRRSWDVPREAVDEIVQGDRAGYRAAAPVHVDVALEKIERRVRLDAHASLEVEVPCGRCLAPVGVKLPLDFALTLVPKDEYAEDEDDDERRKDDRAPVAGSFDPTAADEETYEGKVIDLDPILREEILLALPNYPVCREGCKGLCSVCGQNLNEKDCGCDRHVPDPRWADLKNKLQ